MREGYGWIAISRKVYEGGDPLWDEPRVFSRYEAREDLIQMAAYAPRRRLVGGTVVELERGEILASLRFLATRWNWTVKSVRGLISLLTGAGTLRAQRDTPAGHVYLLENYDVYQSGGHAEGTRAQGTAEPGKKRAQPGHTDGHGYIIEANDAYRGEGHSEGTPKGTARAQLGHSRGTNEKKERRKEEKNLFSSVELSCSETYTEKRGVSGAASWPPNSPTATRETRSRFNPAGIPVPPDLDTPEFREAWAQRLKERGEPGATGGKPSESQINAQLRKLAKLAKVRGVPAAIACVERAIEGRHQGIVFPNDFQEPRNGRLFDTNGEKPLPVGGTHRLRQRAREIDERGGNHGMVEVPK